MANKADKSFRPGPTAVLTTTVLYLGIGLVLAVVGLAVGGLYSGSAFIALGVIVACTVVGFIVTCLLVLPANAATARLDASTQIPGFVLLYSFALLLSGLYGLLLSVFTTSSVLVSVVTVFLVQAPALLFLPAMWRALTLTPSEPGSAPQMADVRQVFRMEASARRRQRLSVAAGWLIVIGVALSSSSWTDDAIDNLAGPEQSRARAVIDRDPVCSQPFMRVTDFTETQPYHWDYSCGLTAAGLYTWTVGSACVEGAYQVGGLLDVVERGRCPVTE